MNVISSGFATSGSLLCEFDDQLWSITNTECVKQFLFKKPPYMITWKKH